jgi:hypothetical protein
MSEFIKNREFLDQVEDYQIPKMKSDVWSSFFCNYKDAYESSRPQKSKTIRKGFLLQQVILQYSTLLVPSG